VTEVPGSTFNSFVSSCLHRHSVYMVKIRPSGMRGGANHGWLDTRHTFSFADYHDPAHMSFRSLRVLNEDRILPAAGFPTHSHRDMEIISYVLKGALEHRDSIGTGSIIYPGDVQRMSAGTGVSHSEYNHSKVEEAHFFQIWIVPDTKGLAPGYEQKTFGDERRNQLRLVASRSAEAGSVKVSQDIRFWATLLDAGVELIHSLGSYQYGWLQLASGRIQVNGEIMNPGDGAAVSEETQLSIKALEPAEFLVFDLS